MSDDPFDWVGLPHRIGADPRLGEGACCLVIASIINDQLGQPFPHQMVPQWIEMARQGDWAPIRRSFYRRTAQTGAPRPGDLHLFIAPGTDALGLGTVLCADWMILPVEDAGVRMAPRKLWSTWEIRRPIP
jgi:hypothetical protein